MAPRPDPLAAAFDLDAAARIRRFCRDRRLGEPSPHLIDGLRWFVGGTVDEAFVVTAADVVPLRGFAGFAALLADALVDPIAHRDTVLVAARAARIEAYQRKDEVVDMCDGRRYAAPADAALLTLWEPPHVEGRAYVFVAGYFVALNDARQTVFRVAVDADTLGVSHERLCNGPLPGPPTPAPAWRNRLG